MLETEGLATTLISLVRPHTEIVKPPRALWVPFPLGHPLGSPGEAEFQKQVLRAALVLLEGESGPVLEDFSVDMPGLEGDLNWQPPFINETGGAGQDLVDLFEAEMAILLPQYQTVKAQTGRTTLGLSGLDVPEIAHFFAEFLRGRSPDNPIPERPYTDGIRAAVEDLKAAYIEVAAARPGRPSGRQLADWLWGDTRAGQVLLELAATWSNSKDRWLMITGRVFIVPGAQSYRLSQQRIDD